MKRWMLQIERAPPGGGPHRSRTARALSRLLVILGLWTLPALVAASQIFVREGGGTPWVTTLFLQLPTWWIWALLTPAALRLAERFPIGQPAWVTPIAGHVVGGTLIVVVYIALQAPFAIIREDRVVTWDSYTSAIVGGIAFQFLSHFLIYVGLVGVGHAITYQRRMRERERHASRLEAELQSARLQSLRAQLQPHFLFNTLHAIGGLVRAGDRTAAIGMLSGLSGLLRHTLDHLDSPEIPLHQEMEALERYIEIEEVRFQDRLEVDRQIGPDVADALVPALILQPIVENAVQHGFEAVRDRGTVRVSARRNRGILVLTVEDDGAGLPEDFDADSSLGLGLKLTRRRLERLYGAEHEFAIERADPRGTRVRISVPFREA